MRKSAGRAPSLRVFTVAFALQLRKKHGKTTVRLRETSVRLIKTSVRVQCTYYQDTHILQNRHKHTHYKTHTHTPHTQTHTHTHTHTHITEQYKTTTVQIKIKYYAQEIETWLSNNPGRIVTPFLVCKVLGHDYRRAATMETSVKSFAKTGLFPCNRHIFQEREFA
jgi:ABC-type Zn2+ transport system substrate-binding protein/surface adhesin